MSCKRDEQFNGYCQSKVAERAGRLHVNETSAPSALELAEGLEQLRFLDMGMPVHMVETELPEGGLWEVNNPTDVAIVEALLPRS